MKKLLPPTFVILLLTFSVVSPRTSDHIFNTHNINQSTQKTQRKFSTPFAKQCAYTHFTELINPYNYPFAAHTVTTSDDYILQLFRIQAANTSIQPNKPVIFMMHGNFDSADDYVVNTNKKSLALVLADQGYDVWLGNNRGNKYCMTTSKPKSNKDFWAFSFQQMA